MTDAAPLPEAPALSQVERVVDTFIAPSKTFTDILRNTSWWLPFILLVLATVASCFAMDKKIGFESITEHQMTKTPAAAEQFQQLPPAQQAARLHAGAKFTRAFTYGACIPFLIVIALEALVLWGSFNFGLGAKTTFGQVFAVIMYSGLPRLFISLLTIIFLFAGVGTESFDIQNPVGTNLGYFLQGSSPALRVAGSFFDVFGLWALALLVIGMAIVARKSMAQAATIIVGWWFLMLLIFTGITAVTS
jgi:hypothetical protein